MKKIVFTLLTVMLSIFVLNAVPDSLNKNDSITIDSITDETDPVKVSLDTIQVQISSALDKMDEIKTMFGQDVDKLNVWIAIISLAIACISYKYTKLGYEASQKTGRQTRFRFWTSDFPQYHDSTSDVRSQRHLQTHGRVACALALVRKLGARGHRGRYERHSRSSFFQRRSSRGGCGRRHHSGRPKGMCWRSKQLAGFAQRRKLPSLGRRSLQALRRKNVCLLAGEV